MHRVIAERVDDQRVALSEEEAHHLVRVLRTRPGTSFLAYDTQGSVFMCRLRREAEGWYGDIIEPVQSSAESPIRICLAQSLIKKDKFEWVIQKAVELGVSEIVPIVSCHTEVRLDESGLEHKMKRWQKIVTEAFKQSRRTMMPTLHVPVSLQAFLEKWSAELEFVLDEEEGLHLRELIAPARQARSCQFITGPEGGWDDRDRQLMRDHSVKPVHLGPRTLRTETAPIAIVSILQYELGDLGPGGIP